MRRIAVLIAFVCSAFGLAQTPESIVQQFVEAVNAKNWQGAAKFIKGGVARPEMEKLLNEQSQIPKFEVSNLSSRVTGKNAIVSLTITAHQEGRIGPAQETVSLEKVGNAWQLVIDKYNSGTVNAMVTIFGSFDIFTKAKEAAKNTSCLSNAKQLSVGILMFLQDNDDVYKLSASNWKGKVMPYVKNEQIFTCPAGAKGVVAYSINSALSGKNSAKLRDPQKIVLIYEGKNGKLVYHKDGKTTVAFADGHAKRVTAAEAKSLKWKP